MGAVNRGRGWLGSGAADIFVGGQGEPHGFTFLHMPDRDLAALP